MYSLHRLHCLPFSIVQYRETGKNLDPFICQIIWYAMQQNRLLGIINSLWIHPDREEQQNGSPHCKESSIVKKFYGLENYRKINMCSVIPTMTNPKVLLLMIL